MFVKPEIFAKAGSDLALFFANTAFSSAERLVLLNQAALRAAFDASMANMAALANVKDAASALAFQQGQLAAPIDKGVDYLRAVTAVVTETKDLVANEVASQVAEHKAVLTGMVEKALASAPAGSEAVVVAVKSAIKAAGDAYDGVRRVAQQTTSLAEASVAAALKAAPGMSVLDAGRKVA